MTPTVAGRGRPEVERLREMLRTIQRQSFFLIHDSKKHFIRVHHASCSFLFFTVQVAVFIHVFVCIIACQRACISGTLVRSGLEDDPVLNGVGYHQEV